MSSRSSRSRKRYTSSSLGVGPRYIRKLVVVGQNFADEVLGECSGRYLGLGSNRHGIG